MGMEGVREGSGMGDAWICGLYNKQAIKQATRIEVLEEAHCVRGVGGNACDSTQLAPT